MTLLSRTSLAALLAALTLLAAPAGAQPVVTYSGIDPVSGDNVQTGDVARDTAGNTYAAGDFQGRVDFDPSDGPDPQDTFPSGGLNNALYLASYDGTGALRWVVFVAAPGPTALNVRAVAVDETQVYVAGFFDGTPDFDPGPGTATPTGPGRQFVAAYDKATGAFRWVKRLSAGIDALAARSGLLFLAGGFSNGTFDFDPGPGTYNLTAVRPAAWVASYAGSDGAFRWAGALLGTGPQDDVDSYSPGSPRRSPAIAADDDRVYLTGTFNGTADLDPGAGTQNRTSAGSNDAYLVTLDPASGALGRASTFGGTSYDVGRALAVDAAAVYVVGILGGPADLDPGAGTATRPAGTFLAAYDRATGAYRWADGFSSNVDWTRLAADGSRVYAAGKFRGTVDFDPGPGVQNRTSFSAGSTTSSPDITLAAYSAADGAYAWANAMGTAQPETGDGVAVSAGRVAVTGTFGGGGATIDFDPGPGTDTRSPATPSGYVAYYDAATGALTTSPVAAEAVPDGAGLTLVAAPNPARGATTLTLTLGSSQSVAVAVFDVLGRRVAVLHDGPLAAGTHALQFDAMRLAPGVYVVRMTSGDFAATHRLTVVR